MYARNALEVVAKQDNETIAGLLIRHGIKANRALLDAVKGDQIRMVRLLLKNDADSNIVHKDQVTGASTTALEAAVENGNPEIIRLLLESGAEPDRHPGHYDGALKRCKPISYGSMRYLLIQHGAILTTQRKFSQRLPFGTGQWGNRKLQTGCCNSSMAEDG